ncbi:T9SS type A sorting domain-containing protein [Hwangdonia sp.]|uniref:T9SS type A sorting domain-containing protein n=1 Tax=Hwangdonia sp. TaxID=1883432 RepID=UPI003AB8A7EE
MKNFYFFLAILFTSISLFAQQTYVPDDNFEQALIDLGYDNVLDNNVQTSNINEITHLDLRFKSISDLTGIEAFTALVNLNCSFNDLTVIDVSSNTALTSLSCAVNFLVALDLSNNQALTNLDCGLNNIISLDLSGNSALTELYCDFNNLANLDVSNGNNSNFTVFDARENPNLDCIKVDNVSYSNTNWPNRDTSTSFSTNCDGGGSPDLTFIPDNNFEQALIDLGLDDVLDDYVETDNINVLTSLDVSNKNISDLSGIEDFVSLTELYCGSNNLSVLDVSNNTALTTLSCFLNNIVSLNLSNNTSLANLSCYFNELISLDLSINTELRSLSCGNNNLVSLDVANGNNTSFTYFDARNNPNLDCIEVDDAVYSASNWTNKDTDAGFSTDCDAVGVDLTYVPDDNFEQALIDLGYDDVLDDNVSTDNIKDIESLNISNMGISDLTGIQAFVSLTSLSCGSNNLTNLDVSNSPALRDLYCHNNNLIDLNVSNNLALRVLSCYLNDLTDLNLSGNPALRALSTGNNSLTSLNVSNGNNSNFTYFDARNNPNLDCIEVDNVSYSTTNWLNRDAGASFSTDCDAVGADLTYVPDDNFEQALIDRGYDDVLDNFVATENIEGITNLNVTGLGITDLTGIEAFVGLTDLSCGSNNLASLDISNSPALRNLFCYNNNLTDLDVSNNPELRVLSCYLNDLTGLDLSGNTVLRALSAGNNSLASLNVRNGNNSNFTYFDARNNPNLDCIEVDNVSYSTTNWSNRDAGASFSTDCGASARSSYSKKENTGNNDNVTLGSDVLETGSYRIYPNPVNGVLNISLNKGMELNQVTFYNTLAQRVLSAKTTRIDVSSLRKGMYLVELDTNKGRLVERIIVK